VFCSLIYSAILNVERRGIITGRWARDRALRHSKRRQRYQLQRLNIL